MRHLLTLLSLLFVGSVWADDFNFNSPRAKAAMEKYQYDKEDLLRDLEAALEHERTKGSLEEAIKIRDAIATLKQQPDAPVSNAQIPSDAVEWNGHYYRVSNKRLPHDQAKQLCENAGGHLVRIESAAEQEFVAGLTRDTASPLIWIDGSDGNMEGAWFFSNGVPMKFFFWAANTPDNHQQIEHHIVMNRPPENEGRWGDVAADGHKASFICEWDGPAGSTQRAKKIPADAVKYKGNYYKHLKNAGSKTWHLAREYCENNGGHLLRIDSKGENDFVMRSFPTEANYWIDVTEAEKEGVYTDSDEKPLGFANWRPGKDPGPNFHPSFAHVGYMWNRTGEWFIVPSGLRQEFICEWEGDGDVSTGSKSKPADAVEWNGHHYWVSNEGTTWHEAKAKCEKMGGHLARITNQAEHNFIDRTLDQKIKTPIKQQKQSERDHWVDGERGADGVWRFSDGTKFSYFNWDGNPVIPLVDTNHRWLALGFPESNHGWINIPSDYKLGFICEWEGGSSAPETPTKPERTKPKSEEPIKKLSPKHAKRVLDDANLWEGKPGVWFLKRANNFSGRTYERLSQSNRIRSALASVNGRLPTPAEMNNPPSRR